MSTVKEKEELDEEKEMAEVEWTELLTQKWNERWWKENGALDTEKLEEGMMNLSRLSCQGGSIKMRTGPWRCLP